MKKIIDWVNCNWIYFFILGIGLTLVLGGVSKCQSKQANQLVQQTELTNWKRHYSDSVSSIYLKIEQVKLDSVKRLDSIKTEYHKKRADKLQIKITSQDKKIIRLQEIADSVITDYREDDVKQVEKCDSAISKLQQVNSLLYIRTDSLKQQSEERFNQAEGYKKQLDSSNKQLFQQNKESLIKDDAIAEINRINQQFRDQIKKDNNWWNRNEKWFYFGGGVILTGLILK